MLDKNWMTVRQAAELIGCTRQHVCFLAKEGQLKKEYFDDRTIILARDSVESFAKQKQKTGRPRTKNR